MGALRKALKTAYIGLQTSIIYKNNFLLGFLSGVMTLIVQLVFWPAFYSAGTDFSFADIKEKVIAGYYLKEIMTYSLVVYFIQKGTSIMNISSVIKQDIMNGSLNIALIRPIRYLWCKWVMSISGQFLNTLLSSMVFIAIIVFIKVDFVLPVDGMQVAFFFLFILLAYVLSFLINCSIGLISFWMLETSSINMILNATIAILSGAIFPINYVNNQLVQWIKYLPFGYLAWFPAQIYLNKISFLSIVQNIVICLAWITLLSLLVNGLWKKGLRRYAAFGG